MCNSVFLLLGSTYPKGWINLTPKLGQVEPHFPIFLKAHHVIMASPVQFILLTEMCKYFLYPIQYSFSRICLCIGFLVGFIEKWLNLPWSPLHQCPSYELVA